MSTACTSTMLSVKTCITSSLNVSRDAQFSHSPRKQAGVNAILDGHSISIQS